MPLSLILLLAVGVLAFAVAMYTLLNEREHARVVGRVAGEDGAEGLPIADARTGTGLGRWLMDHLPSNLMGASRSQERLIRAGFEEPTAPTTYAAFRLALLILLPAIMLLAFRPSTWAGALAAATGGAIVGYLLPLWYLMRRVRLRQERIRRSIPDGLDLLVVCVEAGISLDAAILRVAREVQGTHGDLAHELFVVSRRTNAGMRREEALRGMWDRTAVEELRTLVSSMIQSERWGTSISTVLRVNADALRRKRRQAAEKKAATAPIKMLFPMMFFIMPALFIVILGPAVMRIATFFRDQVHR